MLVGFQFIYDMMLHGTCLMSIYQQTPQLWRAPSEMQQYGWVMLVAYVLQALVFVSLFKGGYESKGLMEGVRFGALVGVLVGSLSFAHYGYMPISLELALYWFVADIVRSVLAGVLVAAMWMWCPISKMGGSCCPVAKRRA